MQPLQRAAIELDVCPQCGGAWLDRGELEPFRARSARYSRIKGTNRTGATAVVVVDPSACFANTMSS